MAATRPASLILLGTRLTEILVACLISLVPWPGQLSPAPAALAVGERNEKDHEAQDHCPAVRQTTVSSRQAVFAVLHFPFFPNRFSILLVRFFLP